MNFFFFYCWFIQIRSALVHRYLKTLLIYSFPLVFFLCILFVEKLNCLYCRVSHNLDSADCL